VISILGKAALNGLLNRRIGLISSVYLYTMCLCAIFALKEKRGAVGTKSNMKRNRPVLLTKPGRALHCFHHHHSLEFSTTFMIKYQVYFPMMKDNNYQYLFMDFDNDGNWSKHIFGFGEQK